MTDKIEFHKITNKIGTRRSSSEEGFKKEEKKNRKKKEKERGSHNPTTNSIYYEKDADSPNGAKSDGNVAKCHCS